MFVFMKKVPSIFHIMEKEKSLCGLKEANKPFLQARMIKNLWQALLKNWRRVVTKQ